MSYTIVTSFSKEGYDKYAQEMLKTFRKYWDDVSWISIMFQQLASCLLCAWIALCVTSSPLARSRSLVAIFY